MSKADELDDLLAKIPASTYVAATRMGTLGENRVGVVALLQPPLRAVIDVSGASGEVAWEATHTVQEGQQVMVDQRCYAATVSVPLGGHDPGGVSFAKTPAPPLNGQPWPKDTAILDGDEGSLRILDGDDIQKAWELRTLAWHPDEAHASSVDVELLPLRLPRDWLKPGDIGHIHLAAGSAVAVGPAKAEVIAVEGRTTQHPPRIVFGLSLAR